MNPPYIFPIQLVTPWFLPNQLTIPTSQLHNWLLDTGSLTERLITHSSNFKLTLLGQERTGISQEEYSRVSDSKLPMREQDWIIREVVLFGNDKPWVFARSVIPLKLWQTDFTDLNSQPLGQRIFNDPKFSRMPFEITKIPATNSFFEKLKINQLQELWGRRSTFQFEDLSMMVCEVFLPDSPAYWLKDLNTDNK